MVIAFENATYKIVVIGTTGSVSATLADKLGKHSAEHALCRYNILFPYQDIRIVLDHV